MLGLKRDQAAFDQVQSSQVDLLAKSEMLNGVGVVFGAEGVTTLGGSGGMLPLKIVKNWNS